MAEIALVRSRPLLATLHRSGKWRAAKWLGLASLAATVLARFAIVDAGRASAADPRATFEPQRRG